MSIGKWFVLALWVSCATVYFAWHGSTASATAAVVFWLVAITHVVECMVFRRKLKAAGGSFFNHVVQTMVFGIFHLRELPAVRKSNQEPNTMSDSERS